MFRRSIILISTLLLLIACNRLPPNYMELSLEKKINAAAEFYARGGLSNSRAEAGISLHGYQAAEAMIPYLRGADGLPLDVALRVVQSVQLRGCPLAGSKVEAEVERVAAQATATNIQVLSQGVMEVIQDDIRIPDLLDELGPGACASIKKQPNS